MSSNEPEVLYQEAATALFLAIEEMEWREALDIIQESPEQVKTWVRSKGTENTTFDWSVWRRLPIHEVCLADTSDSSYRVFRILQCRAPYIPLLLIASKL